MTSGDPNTGLPTPAKFPLYEAKLDEILVLEEPGSNVKAHQREVYCDLWDRLGYFY